MNYRNIIDLGRHRLMCGDSTNPEHVAALMQDAHAKLLFSSPPYSDIYEYSGNDLSPQTLAQFIPVFRDYADIMCVNLGLKKRDHEIITYWDEYISAAHKCGLKLLSWNVWDKINPGSIAQQRFMFPLRHEFIFVFGEEPVSLHRTIPKHGRRDPRNVQSRRLPDGTMGIMSKNAQPHEDCKPLESVIACGAVKSRPVWYPAQMPERLAEEYIKACTNEGDTVIDPFGGSGTTLIACEKLNRKCFIMDINPQACNIIRQRYYKLTEGMIDFASSN